jgi:hypothetical protein
MPCYEYEYDTGIYGFVGNNGIKIATIKKIESSIQETSSEIKLKAVRIYRVNFFSKIAVQRYLF